VLLELPHGLRAELHQGCWPPPVAISNPGRIDPVDQRTRQALRTGGVLGAEASCDGIAFTHLSWAQIIPARARMLSWRGDRPSRFIGAGIKGCQPCLVCARTAHDRAAAVSLSTCRAGFCSVVDTPA